MAEDRGDDAEAIRDHYEALAEDYVDVVETPLREHVTWPAVRELLGDVDGERVLDAGCGPGHYAAALAEDGADVVGVDATEAMVEEARSAFGDVATFETATVGEALPFADWGFDAVLCQLVLSHVPELQPAFAEFRRVLAPGGRLVVATHHPFHDYLVVRDGEYPEVEGWGAAHDPVVHADEPTYADTERFRIDWSGEGAGTPGTYYRRPLSELCSAVLDAGLDLAAVEEPMPDAALLEAYPDAADGLASRPPELLCLRAERPKR